MLTTGTAIIIMVMSPIMSIRTGTIRTIASRAAC